MSDHDELPSSCKKGLLLIKVDSEGWEVYSKSSDSRGTEYRARHPTHGHLVYTSNSKGTFVYVSHSSGGVSEYKSTSSGTQIKIAGSRRKIKSADVGEYKPSVVPEMIADYRRTLRNQRVYMIVVTVLAGVAVLVACFS